MATVNIRLKKVNKIYTEGVLKKRLYKIEELKQTKNYRDTDIVAGFVVVQSKGDLQHQGITLAVEGIVNLQLSAKSVGLFEAFYNSIKPIHLLNYTLDIAKPGKLPSGKTEIPFEVPLKAKGNKELYETYHGVFVNIQYQIKVEMKRSMLNKDLSKSCEFILEYKSQEETAEPKPIPFTITPETLTNIKEKGRVPKFKVKGKIDSSVMCITKPLTGELVLESCETPVKSIEIQLVRVETCGCAEGYAKESTEIQNIQIADGDVCRGLHIPIYMVFPRLFTCPTLITNNFKVEFEINIVVVFRDDYLITENFPIKLTRF